MFQDPEVEESASLAEGISGVSYSNLQTNSKYSKIDLAESKNEKQTSSQTPN